MNAFVQFFFQRHLLTCSKKESFTEVTLLLRLTFKGTHLRQRIDYFVLLNSCHETSKCFYWMRNRGRKRVWKEDLTQLSHFLKPPRVLRSVNIIEYSIKIQFETIFLRLSKSIKNPIITWYFRYIRGPIL